MLERVKLEPLGLLDFVFHDLSNQLPKGIRMQLGRPGTLPQSESMGSDWLKECTERPCQRRGDDSPSTHVVMQCCVQTMISHVGKNVQRVQLLE